MRRIGLLGGMSWESSAVYYRLVNEATRERLGGLHSADCLLRSVDFAEIEIAITIPFVHIADTTAAAVRGDGLNRVGLLATGYTMEQDFYVGRLREAHGLDVLVPGEADRLVVHDVIYRELCVGIVDDGSREEYRRVMGSLAARGAEGILLGCTEIELLVGPDDAPVAVFDTTRLHAQRAVELALAQ